METPAAGILQTPKQIFAYKRIVFDQRGTPIVSLVENHPELKAPPPQINGTIKNVSQDIFKPGVSGKIPNVYTPQEMERLASALSARQSQGG